MPAVHIVHYPHTAFNLFKRIKLNQKTLVRYCLRSPAVHRAQHLPLRSKTVLQQRVADLFNRSALSVESQQAAEFSSAYSEFVVDLDAPFGFALAPDLNGQVTPLYSDFNSLVSSDLYCQS